MKREEEAKLFRDLVEGAHALTREEHIERHKLLHKHLDELVADWIGHTERLPSKATVYELMQWAYQQTRDPTEHKNTP